MATLISTPQDLDNIRNNLSGTFELTQDLDMSSWGNWTPIDDFGGILDGKGYVIDNLTVDITSNDAGLFGRNVTLSDRTHILNLGLTNVNISTTGNRVGALYSYFRSNDGLIENCYVKGGTVNGALIVGGIVGLFRDSSIIRNSFAELDEIHATDERANGFIDVIYSGVTAENCYAVTHSLTAGDMSTVYGFNYLQDGAIVNNCYWDIDTSGVTQSHSGTGLTTAEMQTQSSYNGWDFTNTWGMAEYPYLQMFGAPTIPSKQVTRIITSYVNEIHSQLDVQLPPQTKNITVNSHVSPMSSNTERNVATFRNVMTYVSPIHSNVTTSVKSSNKEIRDVSGHVKPIYSNVLVEIYREPLSVTRNLVSHIKPIQANVDIITSLDKLPMIGYVSVVENPSMTEIYTNPSYSTHVENQSYCEVVK
ncbi:hypothetical protein [Lentibacillus amyloliquefaciens]|uniref:GLUG domain-containing protein n=1 Tax=Lentibacillus amyloliquefaciens TaxID=1472767 RepID=A0A0U4FBI2_9BACI|nr:hypothetical protein [Lentibacillus amyloliquefaciens]ALX47853.1 hypothetical protein AOX59_04090 [Lentibacillus amyloliquefaciens]